MNRFGHSKQKTHKVLERLQFVGPPHTARNIRLEAQKRKITQGEFICEAVEFYFKACETLETVQVINNGKIFVESGEAEAKVEETPLVTPPLLDSSKRI